MLFARRKGDIIPLKLSGKNYIGFSLHLKHLMEGGLAGFLDRIVTLPMEEEQF